VTRALSEVGSADPGVARDRPSAAWRGGNDRTRLRVSPSATRAICIPYFSPVRNLPRSPSKSTSFVPPATRQELRIPKPPAEGTRDEGNFGRRNDERLALRIVSGDMAAWSELYQGHIASVTRTVLQFVHDEAAAEMIASQVFEWIWDHRRSWRRTSVAGFLRKKARTLALNHLRRVGSRMDREEIWAAEHPRRPPSPEEVLARKELGSRLEEAIDALSPRRREAFLLTHVEGLTHRQAAGTMGVSPRTVENHVADARAKLRKRLRPEAEEWLGFGRRGSKED